MKYEELGKGIVRRREQRLLGLFIDGTGLDRATRRINRKVDMSALVRGVTSGLPPMVARYYTLIPYEDDSRQRAFLDAVARAGLQVIVKRLPPKGITRQVSVDPEMSADIVAFALGHQKFSSLGEYQSEAHQAPGGLLAPELAANGAPRPAGMFPVGSSQARFRVKAGPAPKPASPEVAPEPVASGESVAAVVEGADLAARKSPAQVSRIVTVVCPARDVAYSIALARELGADTVTADFGQFNTGDVLKSAAKWIDLSDSETIWRDA